MQWRNCFRSAVFRPGHSIADELQFKQREHIVQMPAEGGVSKFVFRALPLSALYYHLGATRWGAKIIYICSRSPALLCITIRTVPSHGLTSQLHVVLPEPALNN